MTSKTTSPDAWWRHATIYQVYPLSFQDSDGDGRGDLAGALARLDHIEWLGVDAVWLGPVFPSPMADFGYDIADFTGIDPRFGSLADFDRLVAELHRRGVKLIVDFVPNHTSDRHPWFAESRASRKSAKRDWYVWADPGADGGPPNNWLSRFGGSAWQFDAATGQYYYHAFLAQQPDLNWRNPAVRAAMADALRWWMRRGVDGFRIDASAVLAEDRLLRDDPPNPDFEAGETPPPERFERRYTNYRPEVLDWLAELRRVVDGFPDRVLLGEVDGAGERIAHFYGDAERPILHLPLNYRLAETDWNPHALAKAIDDYLALVPVHGGASWLLGGHDKRRIVDIVGREQARVAATLQFTLPGTPVLYQGDDLGLQGLHLPSEQARDPFERRIPGYGLNRDAERAPMRWDDGPNAGFTRGTPWLPLADEPTRNVAAQRDDPRSMLSLMRRLVALRREQPALTGGAYAAAWCRGPLLAFRRGDGAGRVLVVANLGATPARAALDAPARLLLTSTLDRDANAPVGRELEMRGDEAVVLRESG